MEKEQATEKHVGRKPKYDYKSEEFLSLIESYAKKGYTDGEIALSIGLNPNYFAGKKSELTEISETLSRARAQVNSLVRAAFLKTAIGGRTVKQIRYIEVKCECGGKDKSCKKCKGTGWYSSDTERQVMETELAPSLPAQERWLMNYDSEWLRKVKGVELEETQKIEGIDIQVSFNKKEDLEMQKKEVADETDA